jgi:hypothetical protein
MTEAIQVSDGGLAGEMTATQVRIARILKIVEEEKIMDMPEFSRIHIGEDAKRARTLKIIAYVERVYGVG